MRRVRPKRSSAKRFVVYCEGETENNYVNGLKSWLQTVDDSVRVHIDSVCVGGGGYAQMLERLRSEPDSNCIARIVMLDYDRCLDDRAEREMFCRLVGLSKLSSGGNKRVPIILVVSNRDFEYALCCHDEKYADGKTDVFLRDEWGYKDIAKCKADKRIWEKAHAGTRSHDRAIDRLEHRPRLIDNRIVADRNTLTVALDKVELITDNEAAATSNLKDLFIPLLMSSGD